MFNDDRETFDTDPGETCRFCEEEGRAAGTGAFAEADKAQHYAIDDDEEGIHGYVTACPRHRRCAIEEALRGL